MSSGETKEEKVAAYTAQLTELGQSVDQDLLGKIVNLLWPSIFSEDAERVACSDDSELERIVKSSVTEKLGLSGDIESACKVVCEQMGSSNKNKFRASFYYLLVQNQA